MNERPVKEVIRDVKVARDNKVSIVWPADEIAIDMIVVARDLIANLTKYLKKNMEAPAKRAREDSKILDTLGRGFRVQSVKEHNND